MENQTAAAQQGAHCPNESIISAIAPAGVPPPCQFVKLIFKNNRNLFTLICTITLIVLSYSAIASGTPRFMSAPSLLPPQIRRFFSGILGDYQGNGKLAQNQRTLNEVLEEASMPESKTVIITTLNAAWAKENTMIDLFLESFLHGQGTQPLLKHLVIVCVDAVAYRRCLLLHRHCLIVTTPGVNFSQEQLLLSADYIKLMWRRIQFLQSILQLNYSFVFTDTDVLWLRDPFPLLDEDPQADFQIACDQYNGNPYDIHNHPNAGFVHVRASRRTVKLYEYWFAQRRRGARMADQEVFNAMKLEKPFADIGLKMRFLETQYFGGFCALSSTDAAKAITIHANCCKGLGAKLFDLRNVLEEWRRWQAQQTNTSARASHNESEASQSYKFHSPFACPRSWHRH